MITSGARTHDHDHNEPDMPPKRDLCSSKRDKISSLPDFYVDEKFSHQVIYFNTKSSILLCQGEDLHIKFIALLSVANFFKEITNLLIKFLALISSFLYLFRIHYFPCLHNFVEGIKYLVKLIVS